MHKAEKKIKIKRREKIKEIGTDKRNTKKRLKENCIEIHDFRIMKPLQVHRKPRGKKYCQKCERN